MRDSPTRAVAHRRSPRCMPLMIARRPSPCSSGHWRMARDSWRVPRKIHGSARPATTLASRIALSRGNSFAPTTSSSSLAVAPIVGINPADARVDVHRWTADGRDARCGDAGEFHARASERRGGRRAHASGRAGSPDVLNAAGGVSTSRDGRRPARAALTDDGRARNGSEDNRRH